MTDTACCCIQQAELPWQSLAEPRERGSGVTSQSLALVRTIRQIGLCAVLHWSRMHEGLYEPRRSTELFSLRSSFGGAGE